MTLLPPDFLCAASAALRRHEATDGHALMQIRMHSTSSFKHAIRGSYCWTQDVAVKTRCSLNADMDEAG